uniref:Ig-like domain-containing protein n=1 Tax=Erpetoichthys calabaricus TaxID=27687 RepID=A0A8C4T6I3_ERPCA
MLTTAILFFGSERFQVVSPSSTLRALVSEDVTLPASLSPAINAQGFEVRWFRDNFDSPVLLYHNLQIRPEQGRTALFLEELASGNVSLRLQDVRASDRGLYRCFVDSGPWNEEVHITLKVEGHFELPFFVFHKDQQTRLECSSEKWSSQPEVTWRDMNGVDVTSASTITVQRDDEGLLRVSSVIPIKWEFNVFSCLMRSNTVRPTYQICAEIWKVDSSNPITAEEILLCWALNLKIAPGAMCNG